MIIGHERQIAMLATHYARDVVSHAYIFSGPAHVGKATVARAFAQRLLCHKEHAHATDLTACGVCVSCRAFIHNVHPDMYTVAPATTKEGSTARIGIAAMRALKDRASRGAFLGGRKVYIIEHASRMTREAANSFLKVLEEPSHGSVFILVVHAPEDVLPTIASRSWRVRFWPLSVERMKQELVTGGADAEQAGRAAFLSCGRVGVALVKITESAQTLDTEVRRLEHDVYARIGGSLHGCFACAETLAQDTSQGEVWYTEAMALLQLAIHKELGFTNAVVLPMHMQIGFGAATRMAESLSTGFTKAQYPYTNTRLQWESAFAQAQ